MLVRLIRFRADTGDAEVAESHFRFLDISIWAAMMCKYFPQFADNPLHPLLFGDRHEELKPYKEAFWRLIRNDRVPTHERLVLGMTYDKFVVRRGGARNARECHRAVRRRTSQR